MPTRLAAQMRSAAAACCLLCLTALLRVQAVCEAMDASGALFLVNGTHLMNMSTLMYHADRSPYHAVMRAAPVTPPPLEVYTHNLTFPFHIRAISTDTLIMVAVFCQDEFGFLTDHFIQRQVPGPPVRHIMEFGGNIGLVTLTFGAAFPNAKILVLEPAVGNFFTLRLNTAFVRNVFVEHAAIQVSVCALPSC